jgi:hypothetical protein
LENVPSSTLVTPTTSNDLVMRRPNPYPVKKVTIDDAEAGLKVNEDEEAACTLASIKNMGPKPTSHFDKVFNKVMNVHPTLLPANKVILFAVPVTTVKCISVGEILLQGFIAIFRIDGNARFDMSILRHCPAKIARLITHAIAVHSLQVVYENHLVLHLLSI